MKNILTIAPGAQAGYREWLNTIKPRIASVRLRMAFPDI